MKKLKTIILGQERNLGDFTVHRILPHDHSMVGPFIFFDHMGPANFLPGQGVDVRPHPHINLATVTFLFEGKIRHRDNLGSDQLIEPGAINWMVAGSGIVHSERTPLELREGENPLNGIQCWLALPDQYEEIAPSFTHHPKETLPEFEINGVKLKLLIGSAFSYKSPVKVYSDLFYIYAEFKQNMKLTMPGNLGELGVYLIDGKVRINNEELDQHTMAVGQPNCDLEIEALEDSKLMLLGGKSVGPRYIYWNFVSSSLDKIEIAKAEWKNGPGKEGTRFAKIPGDDQEFIPLPNETIEKPKGNIM